MVKCYICDFYDPKKMSLFRIPDRNDEYSQRSGLWIKLLEEKTENAHKIRICSHHFINKKPAKSGDYLDIDWVPNKNLGRFAKNWKLIEYHFRKKVKTPTAQNLRDVNNYQIQRIADVNTSTAITDVLISQKPTTTAKINLIEYVNNDTSNKNSLNATSSNNCSSVKTNVSLLAHKMNAKKDSNNDFTNSYNNNSSIKNNAKAPAQSNCELDNNFVASCNNDNLIDSNFNATTKNNNEVVNNSANTLSSKHDLKLQNEKENIVQNIGLKTLNNTDTSVNLNVATPKLNLHRPSEKFSARDNMPIVPRITTSQLAYSKNAAKKRKIENFLILSNSVLTFGDFDEYVCLFDENNCK